MSLDTCYFEIHFGGLYSFVNLIYQKKITQNFTVRNRNHNNICDKLEFNEIKLKIIYFYLVLYKNKRTQLINMYQVSNVYYRVFYFSIVSHMHYLITISHICFFINRTCIRIKISRRSMTEDSNFAQHRAVNFTQIKR